MGHPVEDICFCCHSVSYYKPCIVSLHSALITWVCCPGIAQSNVTHLAWSSTGWAHEWTDTKELLCFCSWRCSRYLLRCWHCRNTVPTPWLLRLMHFHPLPTNTLLVFSQKCHKVTAVHVVRSSPCLLLGAVGQSYPGDVLKTFPDHCAPLLNLLLVINGP